MKNIVEVRTELTRVFEQLSTGGITPVEAKELNNCAGKIINTLKVELEYFGLTGETPNIPFIRTKK